MSKHTPGPWYHDKDGYIWRRPLNELYEYGGRVAGDKPVACAWIGWDGEGQTGYPLEANARLIAAAPEMLEALQMFLAYNDQGGPISFDTDAMWAKARNVLAKIEGGGE
jgi:hypothetical protein